MRPNATGEFGAVGVRAGFVSTKKINRNKSFMTARYGQSASIGKVLRTSGGYLIRDLGICFENECAFV